MAKLAPFSFGDKTPSLHFPDWFGVETNYSQSVKVKGVSDYRAAVRSAVRGLYNDQITIFDFTDTMVSAITRRFTEAYLSGLKSAGISPSEMTFDETQRLEELINDDIQYVFPFGADIQEARRRGTPSLGSLFERAEMWVNGYDRVRSIAIEMASTNPKVKYINGDTIDPCSDCTNLDQRVYRAEIWKQYDIYPRSRRLKCKGFRCQCVFEVTSDPLTPGRPPNIGG